MGCSEGSVGRGGRFCEMGGILGTMMLTAALWGVRGPLDRMLECLGR